ncbi:SOS response-associated peptidase [Falsiroseomonas ponticola]|uniref:SOS response-associated peptidase n=1 Tax=Falsiroseomonas ponticola TaxID=2786951 RepID=UPI00193251E5|nr:SOS response-associated peptidase [Roseomonas ponticola]
MCGRFFLQRDPAGLARYFETQNPTPNHPASWNIAVTQESLVVRRHPEGARHLDRLRWGLVPSWAKDTKDAARLMNARADGIAEKPSFRDAFRKRRCLVPMDGFYEWRKAEDDTKQAYAVALATGEPMAVAGLWEGWKQPDGTWLRTFTVITTEANEKQALVHHRMPVILPPEVWDAWLGAEPAEPEELLELLVPCPAEELAIWPVDNRVGKVAENDPRLLRRDPSAKPPPELDDAPPDLAG